jgi:hypothetical protein
MKVEKILIVAIVALLVVAVVVPAIILLLVKDKSLAGQIGDALGGTTAPFVNTSAILAVIATYFYQRRNDKKNRKKELIFSIFQNLKGELDKIDYVVTVTTEDQKQVNTYVGKEAVRQIIRSLNNDEHTIETTRELVPYDSTLNIYQYLDSLIGTVRRNEILSGNEKTMFLSQLSLFYRNNLFIDKEQRGDEVCRYHKKIHEIPEELYNHIVGIEKKII